MSPWKPERSLNQLLNRVVQNLAWALAALAGTALFMRARRWRPGAHEVGWALIVTGLAFSGVLGVWLDQNPLRLATALAIFPVTGVFIQRKRMLSLALAVQLACIGVSFLLLRTRLETQGFFAAALGLSVVLGLFIYFMLDALMRRVVTLLARLHQARAELEALADCLPICGWCKKVRDDDGYWLQVDAYLQRHPQFSLAHGICPDCVAQVKVDARKGAATPAAD